MRAEQAMAVEAVIFDFGGVAVAAPFDAFDRFEASRGLHPFTAEAVA